MRKIISINLLFILSLIINLSAYADNVLNDTEYDYDNKTPEEIDKINKEKDEQIKNLLALVEKCKLDPNCQLCPDESDKKNPVKHCVNIPSYISPDFTEGVSNSWFCPSKDKNRAECEYEPIERKKFIMKYSSIRLPIIAIKSGTDGSLHTFYEAPVNNIKFLKQNNNYYIEYKNNVIGDSFRQINITDNVMQRVKSYFDAGWNLVGGSIIINYTHKSSACDFVVSFNNKTGEDTWMYKTGEDDIFMSCNPSGSFCLSLTGEGCRINETYSTELIDKDKDSSLTGEGVWFPGLIDKMKKGTIIKDYESYSPEYFTIILELETDKGLSCPLDSNAKCYKDTDSKYYCSTNPCANGNNISTSKPGDTNVSPDDLIKFPNKKKNNCSADDVSIGDGAMMSCRKGWFGAPLSNNCCIMTPDLKEAQNRLISGFSNVLIGLNGLTTAYAGGAELLKLLGLAEDNFVKEYFNNFLSWFAGGECSNQETTVAQMAGSTRNISYTDLAFNKEGNGKPYGDSTFGENPDLYAKQYGKDYINNGHGKKEHYPGAYGNCVYITTYCAEYYPGGCFKFNIFGKEESFPLIKGCRRPAYAMCCYNSLFDKALALEARHQGYKDWGKDYPTELGLDPCKPDKDKLNGISCQGPSIEDLSNMNLESLTFQDNINIFADVLLKEDGDMMHSIDEAVKNTGVVPTDKEISDLLQKNNMEFNELIKKDPAEVDKFMRKLIETELKDEK